MTRYSESQCDLDLLYTWYDMQGVDARYARLANVKSRWGSCWIADLSARYI